MLGRGVSECDRLCRDENADAVARPDTRRTAREGRGDAARAALYDWPSLQGSAIQLLWFSGRGDKADEHEASSRAEAHPALFGIVKETCGNTDRQSRAVRVGRLDDDGQGYCPDTGAIHSTGRCIVLPSGKVISSGSWQRLGMS